MIKCFGLRGLCIHLVGAAAIFMAPQACAAERGVVGQQGPATKQEKPNIGLVLMDGFGYGDVGVYGGGALRGARAANIGSVAAKGFQLRTYLVEADAAAPGP